jgi:dipeptidyl aminopeptidase/acylaminoacyl peptidase
MGDATIAGRPWHRRKKRLLFVLVALCLFACEAQPEKQHRPGTSASVDEGFSLLSHAMVDSVEQAYLGYASDDLRVTGYLFIAPYSQLEVEPCLIFNHGGVSGVSEAVKAKCRWLAKQGFLVFAPSYRGEDGSQGRVEVATGEVDDVLAAMALLEKHPGVDPSRFVMLGTSHGALISVKAATRPLGKRLLRGVVAAYGVMDIYAWYQYLLDNDFDTSDSLSVRVYGTGPKDKPQAFAKRQALTLIPKLGPAPIMLVQGAKDRIVPVDQARTMKAALEKAGRTQDLLRVYPEGAHGFLFWDDPALHSKEELAASEKAWRDILQFLKAAVRSKASDRD